MAPSKSPQPVELDVDARIVGLESTYETLSRDILRVEKGQEEIGGRLDRFQQSVSRDIQSLNNTILSARTANWPLMLQAGLLIIMLFGLGLTPLWITSNNINSKAQDALNWQKDYQRGVLPSSADPKIAELTTRFTEVETQFKGVNKQTETQIEHNEKENIRQDKEIDGLRERMRAVRSDVDKNTTRLEDHDKYLFPRIQSNSDRIHELEQLAAGNTAKIEERTETTRKKPVSDSVEKNAPSN